MTAREDVERTLNDASVWSDDANRWLFETDPVRAVISALLAERDAARDEARALREALEAAQAFLTNKDGAGFGTTRMEGSQFYHDAEAVERKISTALARGGEGQQ